MRGKLGLFTQEPGDKSLADDLLTWMKRHSADFTNTFRSLNAETGGSDAEFGDWHRRLQRASRQPQPAGDVEALMHRHNPAFIPRNHLVEEALEAATSAHDFSVMGRLLDVLAAPYEHGRELPAFSTPGKEDRLYRTFCGT